MPLRLKSLELHGYKTFASRTLFEFADGITAIVGPNGSGKSNIADSLRWVLGEQSHNLLRAKKTEDMIFAGSEHRPRAGMASVTITFDNSVGWLPVDFSEVAITRRAYRDGRNEYLLNGQSVRLKDLNELLAQSGLSERTYTILGQGMVDASLALKADERRRLFEEAAGIGLYRSRREEALRRLENTQRNLERVLDILSELEPRLRLLEKQAKRAQEYTQVQADLRLVLREWYGYHWHNAQKELAEVREIAHEQERRLTEARARYQQLTQGFTQTRARLLELRGQLNDLHRQSAELHQRREESSRSLAVLEERRRAQTDSRQNALAEEQRLADEERAARERLSEAEAEQTRLQNEAAEAQREQAGAKAALSARLMERAKAENRINAARQELNQLNARRAQLQARQNELKNRVENQRQKLTQIDLIIATAEQSAAEAEKRHQTAQKNKSGAETAFQSAESALAQARQKLNELDSARRARQEERNVKQAEQARAKAQLDVLEKAEASLTGYAEGARALLQAKLRGAQGALSARLEVPAAYETALAAALGEALEAVVFDSSSVEEALGFLEQKSAGRAPLLPLQADSAPQAVAPSLVDGLLGGAAAFIQCSAELRPALEKLLAQTLLVENRAAALLLREKFPAARLVTLKGEVFRPDGLIVAGKETRAATLSRTREKRELSESLSAANAALEEIYAALNALSAESAAAQKEISSREAALAEARKRRAEAENAAGQAALAAESARRQRDFQSGQKDSLKNELAQSQKEISRAEAELDELEGRLDEAHEKMRLLNGEMAGLALDEVQTQVTYWAARAQVSERTVSDARARLAERSQTLQNVLARQQSARRRVNELEAALTQLEAEKTGLHAQESALQTQIGALQLKIEPAEIALAEAEKQESDLQAQEAEGQRALAQVERFNSQAQIDLNRKQEALEALRRRIEEDFGLVQFDYHSEVSGPVPLPLGEMVEQLPVITALPLDLEDSLNQKRAQLRRMGAVNLDAQQEFESVRERFDFMTSQVADLKQAEADLRQVIAELDELTKKEFFKTFEAVSVEFKQIFTRLFGGGSARLILTDPENLTETGIDIEARLPGRREQGLALLSGGERSLTAISLVFALLTVSPTPVCVMDEVDAMLDEANVGRFRDLLTDLGKQTQFVVVTHNRNTVQAADVIYGITKGRDTASQVISLKLDEVSDEMLGRQA
ncbi:MAG: chromosome segregation protein SMC [Anaerolineales bacterium]